jgi:hypothetical protein
MCHFAASETENLTVPEAVCRPILLYMHERERESYAFCMHELDRPIVVWTLREQCRRSVRGLDAARLEFVNMSAS